MKRSSEVPNLRGQKWRDSHQATVDSILGPNVRTIRSQGNQFYNKDDWTARAFAGALCEWARLNKDRTPDRYDVEGWVYAANKTKLYNWQKGIVIASTPDELPKGLSFALLGGGYHEAWHTEWSRRTMIKVEEVWPKILEMWALIPYQPELGKPGWSGLTGPLLEWSNIIEDIRIERLGCVKYPGAVEKMEALQDLILEMEEEGRSASEHRGVIINNDLSVVVGTFRDLGLGYETPKQMGVMNVYKERSAAGWDFVTKGPLTPMLQKSIALKAEDSLESLWLAMEVVAAIAATVNKPPPPKEKKPKAPKGPPPPQAKPTQPELPDPEDEEDEEEEENNPIPLPELTKDEMKKMNLILYKVGDRALLKSGPHAGRTVEVVRAGLPADDGVQDLEFALVEDEGEADQVSPR